MTSDSVLIANNGVAWKWVAITIWSDSIVFNENSITRIIAQLSQRWCWRWCKRALTVKREVLLFSAHVPSSWLNWTSRLKNMISLDNFLSVCFWNLWPLISKQTSGTPCKQSADYVDRYNSLVVLLYQSITEWFHKGLFTCNVFLARVRYYHHI